MSKSIELLKKIKRLSEDGVAGERVNAEALLHKLMDKYAITIEDLEDDCYFEMQVKKPAKGLQEKLFWQLFHKLYPKDKEKINTYNTHGKKWIFSVPLSFKIEFMEFYNFYWKTLNEDIDIFYYAFLAKNKLLCNPNPDNPNDQTVDYEEEQRIRKALLISQHLDRRTPAKKIEIRV